MSREIKDIGKFIGRDKWRNEKRYLWFTSFFVFERQNLKESRVQSWGIFFGLGRISQGA